MSAVVLLSPHLDDAMLSCWHVLSSSADVVVVNVFTAVPPAGTETPRWDRITGSDDSAERMQQRVEEDAAALALAGRGSQNLGFVDSQYRGELPYATEFGWPPWVTGAEADPFLDVDAYWAGHVPEGFEPQLVELTPEQRRTKVEGDAEVPHTVPGDGSRPAAPADAAAAAPFRAPVDAPLDRRRAQLN